MSKSSCNLKLANLSELEVLKHWFRSEDEVSSWGGPHMHFPFEKTQFLHDIHFDSILSYALYDGDAMVAFGQCYDRLGHCHLGRLVVSPQHRRQGYGRVLIETLAQAGCQALNVTSVSLFVLKNNIPAKNLYLKLGFIEQVYPGDDVDMDLSSIDYLIKF